MYFPAENIPLRATWVTVANGQATETSLWYVLRGLTGAGISVQEIAEALDTDTHVDFKNCLSSDAEYKGVMVTDPFNTPPHAAGISIGFTGAGTGGAKLQGTQVRGLITLRTDFAGRRYRGRIYMPFPSQTVTLSSGHPGASLLADMGSFIASANIGVVVGGTGTGELVPVIVHKATGTFTYMTSTIVRSGYGTQRRSGDYGRLNPSPI